MPYRVLPPIVNFSHHQPVTSLAFDPVSDLLWAGTATGSVNAVYGSGLNSRGVVFPASINLEAVNRLVTSDKDVKAIVSK
jgi:PAB-dependent poly(A)-specific ribonuclease subunit 2